MRVFFALLPDSDSCERLSRVAGKLKISGHARRLTPENYHVTLAFIGEVTENDLALYREMGARMSVPRCAIELDNCEYWRSSQAVVLAALKHPCELVPVVDRLRADVAELIPARVAEKSWRAHATLARKVAQAPVLTAMSVSWISRSLALMSSVTGGGRAVYTVVDSWSLLDKT